MIEMHATQRHNEDAEDYVLYAKEKLAKKGISVEKRSLLSALVVTDTMRIEKR
jgi:predicted transglutaminase-like cysteine proteinase